MRDVSRVYLCLLDGIAELPDDFDQNDFVQIMSTSIGSDSLTAIGSLLPNEQWFHDSPALGLYS